MGGMGMDALMPNQLINQLFSLKWKCFGEQSVFADDISTVTIKECAGYACQQLATCDDSQCVGEVIDDHRNRA
ncbi:hypothetical protein AWB74_03304 [Caballeronia arvi]|uniref:Uncharacterized protein n=1 Tax=Caballeronia arvi TaxID=1777135 RepID=A0A158J2J2_9BURK|nr:hypothetical protein AWB74_03304 [Caballeronia arvi]